MLTIVTNSRNDGHGEHQLHRLQAFLDGLRDYREMLDWDVELLLVEWNPPDFRPTLPEVLTIPAGWIRVIQVPHAIHAQLDNSDIVPFFFHVAHNVGVRRAQGDHVLITSQDVLFSEHLARWLALGNFDAGAYYRAMRFDTDVAVLSPGPVLEQVAHLAEHVIQIRPPKPDRLYTKACGDFVMMSRDRWHALRGGFPEFGLFGVFLDGFVVHSAYASGARQVVLDDLRCVYHIYHESQGMAIYKSFPHIGYTNAYIPACERMMERMEPLIVNDADWGLADCDEVEVSPNVWRLEGPVKQRGVDLPKDWDKRPDLSSRNDKRG